MKFTHETIQNERSDAEMNFVIGPSVQWRITDDIHLNLAALFGLIVALDA